MVEAQDLMTLIGGAEHIQLLIGDPDINTQYPIINIKRDLVSPMKANKDFGSDRVQFSIKVYSDDYKSSIDIADAIRFALEWHTFQDTEIRLVNIELVSCSENWVRDAYEQSLTFNSEVEHPILNQTT
ncbi:MAG: DUF3168 domain-containing protein [Oscillospiraceae bacterium]|nr:DUF3168 domain-containing protein [Oscillospiraceae bacterium]